MKATYDPAAPTSYKSPHRLEGKCFFQSYQVISLASKPHNGYPLHAPIDLRLYGTGTTNSACLWVNTGDVHTCGSGKAGGYGYHRPSAAAAEAIRNAGFTISQDISGAGENAIEEALLALAKCLKIKRPALIRSHP